jgi:hypothetical protein
LRIEKIAFYSRKNSKAFRKSSLSIPGEAKELVNLLLIFSAVPVKSQTAIKNIVSVIRMD